MSARRPHGMLPLLECNLQLASYGANLSPDYHG